MRDLCDYCFRTIDKDLASGALVHIEGPFAGQVVSREHCIHPATPINSGSDHHKPVIGRPPAAGRKH